MKPTRKMENAVLDRLRDASWGDRARREGEDARFEGVARDANPYPTPGVLHGVWDKSWLDTDGALKDAGGKNDD